MMASSSSSMGHVGGGRSHHPSSSSLKVDISSSSSSSSGVGGGGGGIYQHHPARNEEGHSTSSSKEQQLQQHHLSKSTSTGITTMASPTSSSSTAASSICSSSPPSSSGRGGGGGRSSSDECDEECDSNECEDGDCPLYYSMQQDESSSAAAESSRFPSNSTSMNTHQRHTHTHHSSTCRDRSQTRHTGSSSRATRRRRRRTHDSRHHPLLQTSIISSSSSSTNANNHNIQQQNTEQPLFSPITSNGSVISNTSSTKSSSSSSNHNKDKEAIAGNTATSNPASPLKSSIGSLLPPPPNAGTSIMNEDSSGDVGAAAASRGSPSAGDGHASLVMGQTDGTDTASTSDGNASSTAALRNDETGKETDAGLMDMDEPPMISGASTGTTSNNALQEPYSSVHESAKGEHVFLNTGEATSNSRPPSNPRKSARRHSENGMKTPDESIYSHLPFVSPSSMSFTTAAGARASIGGGGGVEDSQKEERFAVPTSMNMGSRTISTPAPSTYTHPGTPAVTSATIPAAANDVPMSNALSSTVHVPNPGERRIAHETTRPARRKVHRVDTGNSSDLGGRGGLATGRSISTPGALRSSKSDFTSSSSSSSSFKKKEVNTVNPPLDRVVSPHTTFQRHPHPNSYFAQSNTTKAASAASSSQTSARPSDSTPATAVPAPSTAARSGSSSGSGNHASMAFDHATSTSSSASFRKNNGGGLSTSTTSSLTTGGAQDSRPPPSSSSTQQQQNDYLSHKTHQQQPSRSQSQQNISRSRRLKESKDNLPHMDIATFPTNTLLQLLAALLTKITAVNDAIRDGEALPSSSSSSNSTSSVNSAGTNGGEVTNGSQPGSSSSNNNNDGQDIDSTMEGDDFNGRTNDNGVPAGTTTPPSQSYTHSRNGSNEPVTPAVPFSSPEMSRSASTSTSSSSGRNGGKKEDAFAHDSRLTESSSSSLSSSSGANPADEQQRSKKLKQEQIEDEALEEYYKPRHNFYRPPPTSPQQLRSLSKETATGTVTDSDYTAQRKASYAGPSVPFSASSTSKDRQHTILTSAAQALATPNATLCFHARNIPSISIEAYLIRISKYCPTTNEVFISLLVYFDRMSRLPNLSNLTSSLPSSSNSNSNSTAATTRDTQNNATPADNAAANSQDPSTPSSSSIPSHTRTRSSSNPVESTTTHPATHHSHHSTFSVDSFNIHRLIIAGVTVASKFFSDVFYTNSRYAKVGGLPLTELNALELQFLLLNGFDLIVSPEELQRYADYLLTGALPPLALDSPDRFGSRSSANTANNTGRATTTPIDTPPSSRAATPSKPSTTSGSTSHGLFGQAVSQSRMRMDQLQGKYSAMPQPTLNRTPGVQSTSSVHSTPSDTASHQSHSTFPSSMIDSSSSRPKTSTRSASESSTSASEASTVVPSESSVDTERGEVDHSTADEDTGVEDDEDIDGDSRMTDVSGAPSPAAVSQPQSFAQMQSAALQHQQQQQSTPIYPSNATLGADRDGFAIPARPRPPLSRTSSGGTGQRHPLLASSAGSKTPSNGGSSGGHSSGGKTSAAQGSVNTTGVKASTGKASTTKGTVSMHRRDNSRTREWTLQQQQQMHLRGSALNDEDAEMADEE